MAITQLTDLIVPEVYLDYFNLATTRLDAFIQSGVVGTLDGISFPDGGQTVQVPFLNDLSGDSEVLDDDGALTAAKRGSGKMAARCQYRGKAWAANELAAAIAGVDPLGNIAALDAKFWMGERQKIMLNSLNGFFTTAAAANQHDISAAATTGAIITSSGFIDAAQKLGDAKSALAMVVMHSATEAVLAKADLIEYQKDSEGRVQLTTFMGKRVIVDDSLAPVSGVYTTYAFAPNSVGFVQGNPASITRVETDRDALRGDDYFIRREAFIMHPMGAKWTESSVSGSGPTNAELATAANWGLYENQKNVRIIQFKHKLEANA